MDGRRRRCAAIRVRETVMFRCSLRSRFSKAAFAGALVVAIAAPLTLLPDTAQAYWRGRYWVQPQPVYVVPPPVYYYPPPPPPAPVYAPPPSAYVMPPPAY